jgi:hypothetical protein
VEPIQIAQRHADQVRSLLLGEHCSLLAFRGLEWALPLKAEATETGHANWINKNQPHTKYQLTASAPAKGKKAVSKKAVSKKKTLTMAKAVSLCHLPLLAAASRAQMSGTYFKKLMKTLPINHWPYRQIILDARKEGVEASQYSLRFPERVNELMETGLE